jgi:hypothetical protein
MSYARMEQTEARLMQEVQALLAQATQVDATEDTVYGPGRRGDELPAELARRQSRLAVIRTAKAALEADAKAAAVEQAAEAQAKRAARDERVGSAKGRPPTVPEPEQARPAPKAQRNFTDPESRIMKDGATKGFEQAYNAQAVVDGHAQVIVACALTQEATDVAQFVPLVEQIAVNTGQRPGVVLADAGYFSEANVIAPTLQGIALYVPPDRIPHTTLVPGAAPTRAGKSPVAATMREQLATAAGRAAYALRKSIVEPVFGQIKEVRGFRRFALRGVANVRAEWQLICLTHNLLKLFRSGWTLAAA